MDKKKLVLNIVKEYLYRGLTEEELKQAGLDGLEIAERKYDKRADFSFESYAVWWMLSQRSQNNKSSTYYKRGGHVGTYVKKIGF